MKTTIWNDLSAHEREEILRRPQKRQDENVAAIVREIFEAVSEEGAAAVDKFARDFDGAPVSSLTITVDEARRCRRDLSVGNVEALEFAAANIRKYHEAIKPRDLTVEIAPGVTCRRVYQPIDTVGIYVPGGTAMLVSSLLMTAIPAVVAGVPNIVAVTPPPENSANRDLMVFAAQLCGLDKLYFVGGAQAVAAMTFGAGDIPKVDKIFGPGNAYVAAAKSYAASLPGGPAMDLPAGPSELMVIADGDDCDARLIALDLLSQAEHDADAQVMLVATNVSLIERVADAIKDEIQSLPRRSIAEASLANARCILVSDFDYAIAIANAYAPEHLSIISENAGEFAKRITSSGAIFAGASSAESFGDYVCGPSHVLPTDGAGRAWNGVSTDAFMRAISIQEISAAGASQFAAPAAAIARLEGLEAHARAAVARARETVGAA
ncbi:MAG: histidinol dehydrogenase [Marinicaulis sp.]|nr:histidinol dehydrogenase [Marinicaulis sp.]